MGASLTAIGRIDIDHSETFLKGLIFNLRLQLKIRPPVEPGSNPFTGFNSAADVFQVFEDNYPCLLFNGFLYNLFAHLMVDLLHTASFFTRDFLQQLFCRLRTVGLKASSFGKKLVSFVTDLASIHYNSAAGR